MIERIIALFKKPTPQIQQKTEEELHVEDTLISSYVDILNRYGLGSSEETAFYEAMRIKHPDSAELCLMSANLQYKFDYARNFNL